MNQSNRHIFKGTEARFESKIPLFPAQAIRFLIVPLRALPEKCFKIGHDIVCHVTFAAAEVMRLPD
jgi:hypothetical protein